MLDVFDKMILVGNLTTNELCMVLKRLTTQVSELETKIKELEQRNARPKVSKDTRKTNKTSK